MANSREKLIYEFEDFRLDAAHLILRRASEEISLTPKAVETLLALVERRGEIIGKDELMEKIWSDAVVEESNLSQYLHILRKTLGNRNDGKPFIETLRRRGYRFNGDVRVLENDFSKLRDRDEEETKKFRSDGDGESQIKNSKARPLRVERRGNVLALADWTENEKNSGESEAAELQTANPNFGLSDLKSETLNSKSETRRAKPNYRFAAIAGIAAVLILLATILFVRYKSAPNFAAVSPPAGKGELTFLRLTNGVAVQDAAMSPDGNYLAYSENDGETARIFVQQTGQSNRLEIVPPTTERKIAGKTFSPDGSFVYFLSQDKSEEHFSLYRVATLGGAQTKILDDVHSPVSFSPDGREMAFHRWNRQTGESALVIAASDGSGAEKILQKRGDGQEVLLHPAWSPDGEWIAFAALHPQGSQSGFYRINRINLQTGEIIQLSPEDWETCYRMVWTRNGAGLVFVGTRRGEVLSTRRDNIFYLSALTGEARRLTVDGNRYQLFSLGITDDDSVVVVPNSNLSQIWQMSSGGDSRTAVQITHGAADGRAGIAPLPDGRVGYITRTGEDLRVWLMNGDGTDQKQLTDNPLYVEELRASPDGGFFVFAAKYNGDNRFFRISPDGSDLRQLTFGKGVGADSTVSPDGRQIVYHSDVFDGGYSKHALWRISSAGDGGEEPIRIGEADCKTPHFSPDGKLLSCIRREKEILVLQAETGAVVKTFQPVQPAVLNTGARWTRDGQNLVYRVFQKKAVNLWLQPISGGAARQLTDFTANGVHNFAFSNDGSRLYVVRAYQINDAVLIKHFR